MLAVEQLVIIALRSAMKEQHDMKNVTFSRKKKKKGRVRECEQVRVDVEKAAIDY